MWTAELGNVGTNKGATHATDDNFKRFADANMDRPHGTGLYPLLASRSDFTGLSYMEWKDDVLHWKIRTLEKRWLQKLAYFAPRI